METVKGSVVTRSRQRKRDQLAEHKDLRAVELLCVILQWSIHVLYLSKPTKCIAPKVNRGVTWTLGDSDVSV